MRVNAFIGRAAILSFLGLFGAAQAHAEVLITPREGKLPSDDTTSRGIYIGPKIVVLSPARNAAVKSPFDLKIEFERRDGVDIDLNSLVVTYRKIPPVDLTDRLKEFVNPDGIDMSDAEVPPGEQRIHVEIKDADGRVGGTDFSFDVTP